jgi:Flp pilus assembly protein TadG
LTAFLLVFMVILVAFAIDIGYIQVAKVQLQQAADAAALAATAELIDDESLVAADGLADEITAARSRAVQYAALNPVCLVAPVIDPNTGNSASGEVVVGNLPDPSNPAQAMNFIDPNSFNAVQVRVQRTVARNGEVGLFFARVFGSNTQGVQATATAAILRNIRGFSAPSDGSNLGILPFALDKQTWDDMLAGGGGDQWSWNPTTKTLTHGSDTVREVNLYPQGTGSPGNRGTVDIGGTNNSTNDIARQIVHGVSAADLAQMPGGKLALGDDGTLSLNGDTGISAGVKDELASIRGQTRVIPIFTTVNGNGNNAQYTIVALAGIRILDVKLTGAMSGKRLTVQPANVQMEGALPSSGAQTSQYVYSPVWLVR